MPRTADYTIQGFLYQFNKTLLEILRAQDEDVVTVEGIVEDIDVATPSGLTAVQCKYHEASSSFTPSKIFKPILQMLLHFSDNQEKPIEYILFAHFPKIGDLNPSIDKCVLENALASTDKNLEKYINAIPEDLNLENFLRRFSFQLGPSYDEITSEVCIEFESNGISQDEINILVYPNAIHKIASLSIKHNLEERKITKRILLSELTTIRKTAISRWTLALKSKGKLLQARRKQLKSHLDINSRLRYFIFNPDDIDDYESEIVLFISDYIEKYHFKASHISTPILCLCANQEEILEIQNRLYKKDIVSNNGFMGGKFEEKYFFRDPFMSKGVGNIIKREFSLRVLSWYDRGEILNERKCDDLFVFGKIDCDKLDTVDINIELMEGTTIKEIKYILGVSDVYE